MALWLVRAGRFGEHEQRFLSNSRIYLTWAGVSDDLSQIPGREQMFELLRKRYPAFSLAKMRNHAAQIWAFVHRMSPGDWVVVPSKVKPAIHIAEITGAYTFDKGATDPYYHSRSVKWIAKDIPRSVFAQDLLYSFGAIMTICQIKRNDAEQRVRALAAGGWTQALPEPAEPTGDEEEDESGEIADVEEFARDQIAKQIIQKFKGHGLERLVEAILRAQGYTTYHSPAGPDKGIDLLAAPGSLGFGSPRICVQVKSSDSPTDSATLNQLIGSMQNVQAEQGLLVSWGGFKSSIDKEVPTQFFRVRLWDQQKLIEQLMEHYDKLDEDFKAELPLKRIWALAVPEDEQA
jgi:restriction system protein